MKNKSSTIKDCKLVNLSKIHNQLGNLTVLENNTSIPFEVKRLYYLYDVPSNEERGGHSHFDLKQYIVAASGSFDITIDDGINSEKITLNRPDIALYIVPGIWRDISNFSGGSICLVLASENYDENDYIRNYTEFKQWKFSK